MLGSQSCRMYSSRDRSAGAALLVPEGGRCDGSTGFTGAGMTVGTLSNAGARGVDAVRVGAGRTGADGAGLVASCDSLAIAEGAEEGTSTTGDSNVDDAADRAQN